MKRFFLLACILILGSSAFSQKSIEKKLKKLDVYFEQARADWEVPGMAIAIVSDGEVIFSKGYGIRNTESGEAVDGNTLFAIASNSKSFTTAALAMLVDEGKLSWSDKVREYLPWFELYDPYVSENFTITDLLTHRSGLATFSGDLLWYGSSYGREEVVRRAKYLEPVAGFRERYGYNNIMYIAAGLIVEELSGMSWDDFVKERILEPLHMERTISSTLALKGMENVSSPHNDVDEAQIPINWLNWDNVAPAGALISSVNDVSKWLMFQLNKGIIPEGDTLIKAERFKEMWSGISPQYVSSWSEGTWPTTHYKSYGLGWATFDYQGRRIIGHGGGYDGFISNTTFVPEEDMGFVILTNKNTSLYYPLKYKILDVMFDVEEQTDWSADFLALFGEDEDAGEEEVISGEMILPIDDYTGNYHCKMYGDAKVYLEAEQMMLQLVPTKIFKGEMTHLYLNTWKLEFKGVPALPEGTVHFIMDEKGKISEMQIDVPNPDFDFTELKFYK